MPTLISQPTVVAAAGSKPKQIQEFAGRANSGHGAVSVARMVSPKAGWTGRGRNSGDHRRAEGLLRVEHESGVIDVRAGQAIVSLPGEWVRYSGPEPTARKKSPCACRRSRQPRSTATDIDDDHAIETHGLRKAFGEFTAVDGIDLLVPRGSLRFSRTERRKQIDDHQVSDRVAAPDRG
jgi:hypothetical protein